MSVVEQVRGLGAEYSQLLDNGRLEAVAGLYAEDGVVISVGTPHHGRKEILTWLERVQSPERRGTHMLSNLIVESLDADRAVTVTDFIFIDQAMQITTIGRYHDVVVRQGDVWRYASRDIRMRPS